MSYTSYLQIAADLDYEREIDPDHRRSYVFDDGDGIDERTVSRLRKEWLSHVKEKYEAAKQSQSRLGNFLRKYPLKFQEFRVLLELIDDDAGMTDFEKNFTAKNEKDVFKAHKVRYESSQLRRDKLVYKIVNPLRPMRTVYEISYRAQLGLKGQKYTDEYQQLDMALEEESKKNSPDELDSLYYAIEPTASFNDLIASDELKAKLKAALSRETKKQLIFNEWGFGKTFNYGRGTTLNFRGLPGTGKTLAANCFAKELGRKLLMVRYDQLQSMWVGQTEKNIQRVFSIARSKNAVLFFDEADAVALGRENLERSYEMSQINTLLKELERFDGVCIFATNFAEKYDHAFERRLTMHIDFTLPDEQQQIEILEKILPKKSRSKKLTLSGLDLAGLSGGDLKNVALNAAGIAARNSAGKIDRKHLEEAVKVVQNGKLAEGAKDSGYIS